MSVDSQKRWFRGRVLAWGRENRRQFPWRETDDPFEILVAEVLLQRSRGKTVAKVFAELFERWPDAPSLAAARTPSIEKVIRPLGLVKRAGTLKAMAKAVVNLGLVPRDKGELMELPGVGEYAASATAAVAFGLPVPTVDGVSARVYRRFFGLGSEVPPVQDRDLWDLVAGAMPKRQVQEWNWAVLDLAAAVCLPKVPRCPECPLRTRCAWSAARA